MTGPGCFAEEPRLADTDFAVTRQQAREIDRIAISEYGVKGLILMEHAGRACAREAVAMLGGAARRQVVVFCGSGNNGGDGFVVARHLENWGCQVQTYLVGRIDAVLREADDAAANLDIALSMDIPVVELKHEEDLDAALAAAGQADLVVDALLGTGLAGEVRGIYRPLIERLNALAVPILSVDVPSGLDCDTGRPLGVAVRATRTVTFVLPKLGFRQPGAERYTGLVKVAEIGVPRKALESRLAAWREQER